MRDDQKAALLTLTLQNHLYRHFFCAGSASPHAANWHVSATDADAGRFNERLAEANYGTGFWDPGWQVCAGDSSTLQVTKDGLTVRVPRNESLVRQGVPSTTGVTACLRYPNGSFSRSPGFYVAYSDEPLLATAGLVRLYWNSSATGAEKLVQVITRRLNDAAIPFHLKVLADPRQYARCDAVVLYIAAESYASFRSCHGSAILRCLAGQLAVSVPAMTKRVGAGVGVAENPTRYDSFGSDRCRVLAEAIVSAFLERRTSLHQQLDHVARFFRDAGIDPARPYLNAASSDDYEPLEPDAAGLVVVAAPLEPKPPAVQHDRCLTAASEIGALIARQAVWHEHQCNWLGALGPESEASPAPRFGSLGADFYDGTSGIAFFLGHLFAATGDPNVRRTAVGAIRHALSHFKGRSGQHHGFYVGHLGAAVVAARLGILLDREDLLQECRSLATTHPTGDSGFDLIAGLAGQILGFIVLDEIFPDDAFLDYACALGKQLVASADRGDNGVSWNRGHDPRELNLTGFSHGAAGAAYALLELFSLSGDDDFRSTAEAAFEYERSWFDARERNWPDFRQVAVGADPRTVRLPYSNTWCHGAPGIAVSRLRAWEILNDRRYLYEALTALATTRNYLRGWLRSGRANFSLCHGLAGHADVLLTALRSHAWIDDVDDQLIRETAAVGLETYGGNHSLWPCGVGGGATPSLMVGWAGIGQFYLRLARGDVASPLAPRGQGPV